MRQTAERGRETEVRIQRGVGVGHSPGNQPGGDTHPQLNNRDDGEAVTEGFGQSRADGAGGLSSLSVVAPSELGYSHHTGRFKILLLSAHNTPHMTID
jgi:hypothetical protein